METSNKKAVLAYIRNNPGCTATAVANEVFGKWHWSGWIFARNDISALCDEGLVDERFYRGISVFTLWKLKRRRDVWSCFRGGAWLIFDFVL